MGNIENLKYKDGERHEFTQEEAKKGNENSIKARKEKKGMQNITKWLLSMPLTDKEVSLEDIQSFAELKGKNITVEQAIMIKQLQKALNGDLQSATFIRDTSGQKPKEEINVSGELNNPYSELTTEELRKLAGD